MTIARKVRWGLLSAAVILQLAVALSLLGYSARVKRDALRHGRIISLACRASDPFSPFKGRYVKLSIAESQLQGNNLDAESQDNLAGSMKKKIYCRMVPGPDGLWTAAGIRREISQNIGEDMNEGIYIEAKCSYWHTTSDSFLVRAAYAFDEYYMQENFAAYADSIRWDDFNTLEPILSLYVARDGRCIQKDLTVLDGQERIAFEDYCRRKLAQQ
ncbi:MAG: GDYXXLXY domain-containing protein [Treponema sp.]|nr:GDYXXLXY domain-containing protein [Treponema sp.]